MSSCRATNANGIKPPSFCVLKPWARKLADDLEMRGVPVLRYT